MRKILWVLPIVILVITFSPATGSGKPRDLTLFYNGNEIPLHLKFKSGRFYGKEEELIHLWQTDTLYSPWEKQGQRQEYIPLREFWEDKGFLVQWLPGQDLIIVGRDPKDLSLPRKARKVIASAIADTKWLMAENQEELANHLAAFYTTELAEELLIDIWPFIQVETDWHSLYQLDKLEILDGVPGDWLLLGIKVEEYQFPQKEKVYFFGIVKLVKLDQEWKIVRQIYYDI